MHRSTSILVISILLLCPGTPDANENAPPPPDCSKLTPVECRAALDAWREASGEWARQLSAARALPDGWNAGCSQDKVTLEWTCFATKFFNTPGQSNPIRVQHHPSTGYCFSATLNDHPGRRAVIRIGKNEPIYYEKGMVCGSVAQEIIDQLMEETDGATRGTTWPGKLHEFSFDSTGFPTAFQALRERVENPRP